MPSTEMYATYDLNVSIRIDIIDPHTLYIDRDSRSLFRSYNRILSREQIHRI